MTSSLVQHFKMKVWERRIQRYRKGDPAVFSVDTPGYVNPRDVHITVPEAVRQDLRRLAERGDLVAPGNWDLAVVPLPAVAAPAAVVGVGESPAAQPPVATVAIGRHGAVVAFDGQDRLTAAAQAGEWQVPVRVALIHSQWQKMRNAIQWYADRHEGRLYMHVVHPDLGRGPSLHSEERIGMLHQHLPVRSGTLLDIGAHWGYFCHQFESLGFACHAVERSWQRVFFLSRIRQAMARTFTADNASIFDLPLTGHFSVVLALNIFHHFLKSPVTHEKLRELLRRLDMDFMFFEPHKPGEVDPRKYGDVGKMSPEEFVQFVATTAGMKTTEKLGTAKDGRSLYLLSRR